MKIYTCICGKTFDNPQKFNGHKRHCKHHLLKVGKLDKIIQSDKTAGTKCSETLRQSLDCKKQNKLEQWVSEQHQCIKCGKTMTEQFGSGLYCSRSCANSHKKSDKSKIQTSETLRGRKLTEEEIRELLNPKKVSLENKYVGPELPAIKKENLEPGYFSRSRMSYAEKFWQQVLDNNHVSYKHDFKVKNRAGTAVYRLDFLIGDVDLEIDGEEHEKCLYKDIVRTTYLEELGYRCYRIRWVNPTTDKNKIIVNGQIECLFKFLNLPRIC